MPLNANQLLALLFASYPVETVNVPPDKALASAQVYAACLADIENRVAIAAITITIKTSRKFPSVADIRHAVVELRHGSARAGGDAWGDLKAAMRKYAGDTPDGAMRKPGIDFHFQDPIVARVVERLGWKDFLHSKNPTSNRARFIELYDKFTEDARSSAVSEVGAKSRVLPLRESKELDIHIAQNFLRA